MTLIDLNGPPVKVWHPTLKGLPSSLVGSDAGTAHAVSVWKAVRLHEPDIKTWKESIGVAKGRQTPEAASVPEKV